MTADSRAQGPIILFPFALVAVGVILIIIGITTAQDGCVGTGLMWIGGGILVGDFGGVLFIQHPAIFIGGGAGFVMILVGAGLKAFGLTC